MIETLIARAESWSCAQTRRQPSALRPTYINICCRFIVSSHVIARGNVQHDAAASPLNARAPWRAALCPYSRRAGRGLSVPGAAPLRPHASHSHRKAATKSRESSDRPCHPPSMRHSSKLTFRLFRLRIEKARTTPQYIDVSRIINKTLDAMGRGHLAPSKQTTCAETRAASLQQFVMMS